MARPSRVVTWVTLAVAGGIGIEAGAAALQKPTPRPVSPRQVASDAVRGALAAAGAAGSFHYEATWHTIGSSQTIVGDAAASAGTQTVDDAGARFSVVLADRVVYVRGDARALHDQLGLPSPTAAAEAGAWISVTQTDAPYQTIEQGVTSASALSEVLIDPRAVHTVRLGARRTRLRVTGGVPPSSPRGVLSGSVLLEVATRTRLPQTYAARGSDGGARWSSAISFSRWGEPAVAAPPTTSVPYATLLATGPTTAAGRG